MIDFQLRYTLVSFYSSLFFLSSDDSRVMSILWKKREKAIFIIWKERSELRLLLNEYDLMRGQQ